MTAKNNRDFRKNGNLKAYSNLAWLFLVMHIEWEPQTINTGTENLHLKDEKISSFCHFLLFKSYAQINRSLRKPQE